MHRTTLLIPKDLHHRAQDLARRRQITLSELIRRQLEEVLEEESPNTRQDDPLFALGTPDQAKLPSDLSVRHDDYLYGE